MAMRNRVSGSGLKPGAGPPTKKQPLRPHPAWLVIVVIQFLVFLALSIGLQNQSTRLDVPYSVFKQQVEARNVVEVNSSGDTIQGTFKNPLSYPPQGSPNARTSAQFQTVRPEFADAGLETLLEQKGVVINAHPIETSRSWWMNLLLSFGPALLLVGGFLWLSKRASGGGSGLLGFGRSRARRYDQSQQGRITFADVAGIDEAKAELVEVVEFLVDPAKYTRLGGTVPNGVLLVGPPGTGKTLLARAVAGEAGVPFFSMGASEFVEMFVGVGASRVRDLFKGAREAAPAIIFLDELDAIGRARGTITVGGGSNEQEQTLNQILTEMDGFSSREGVIVIAATNRPDVLDLALLRPGRFDRRVVVQPPDKVGREAILKVHTRGLPLGRGVDLKALASSTPGLVGADLRNLVNEAALLAARRNKEQVQQTDFVDALEKLVLGPARSLVMSPAERQRVAYHEGGHTVVCLLVPGADPVSRVTIIPHGQVLGVTYQRPEDDRHNYSEEYLRSRLTCALGGRAAEEVVYVGRTTGAEDDMQQATELARHMVTRWGMSLEVGPVTLAPRDDSSPAGRQGMRPGTLRPYSEATAQLIDAEIRRILERSYKQALRLLEEHRPALDALARALLERESLDEREIHNVTGLSAQPGSEERRADGARGSPTHQKQRATAAHA